MLVLHAATEELDQTPLQQPDPEAPQPAPPRKRTVRNDAISPTVRRIHDLIDDTAPHTWVFTGDAFGFETRLARRSWVEHFTDVIRGRLARAKDVVLDTTSARSSFAGLLRNLDWQVLRFQPDVVVMNAGPDDVLRAQSNRESMQSALTELTELLQHEGCAVILCSPPLVAGTSNEQLEPLLETLQSVAEACRALFVDHHGRWSEHQAESGSMLDLLNASGTVPSASGHRKLARDLIAKLEITR